MAEIMPPERNLLLCGWRVMLNYALGWGCSAYLPMLTSAQTLSRIYLEPSTKGKMSKIEDLNETFVMERSDAL